MEELVINPSVETAKIIQFLRVSLSKTPFKKIIIGLSGGIDSALCAALSVQAFGKNNVYPIYLPYDNLGGDAQTRVDALNNTLSIPQSHIVKMDITPKVNALIEETKRNISLRKGNVIARTRMILLYDRAKKHEALVCGTENKTEYLLGYFTRFGDEASDIEPIRHLYKTQVRQLASHVNLPLEIINAVPTAQLWDDQTDEEEFGFSYQNADQILYYFFDKKMTKDEIYKMGFDSSIVEKVLKRVEENAFKHHLPYQLDI